MSLRQNNKILLVHDKRCFVSHWPPASEIGLLLMTTLLKLRRMHRNAGRSSTCRLWTADANSHIPYNYPPVKLRCRFQNDIFMACQGNDMACVNLTWPHCVNQVGKTKSKLLAEWHGLCKSALRRVIDRFIDRCATV
jgi:hypothetical protein